MSYGNAVLPGFLTFYYKRTTSGALSSLAGLRLAAVGWS